MTTIAVLVGSLSQSSLNKKLAAQIVALLPADVVATFVSVDLPLFNYDLESALPESVQVLKRTIESADGVLFVTPEYNRSFSGVLKNAIDWASRPWGKNSFAGKPAAIIGASVPSLGTTQAQQQLRNVALFLDMKVLGQPELYVDASRVFDEEGKLRDESRALFADYVTALVAHVKRG